MNLNSTPLANRCHISIFGRINSGKSSLLNALTSQDAAIVSSERGTTTDPVSKAIELHPLGPSVIFDTAGLDDLSGLGNQRLEKTMKVLAKTDIAIVNIDAEYGVGEIEKKLINILDEKNIPYIKAVNKSDIVPEPSHPEENTVYISALTGEGIPELLETLARKKRNNTPQFPIVSDLINAGDIILLVIPIDESAPKGRLILPQQQTIREILDMSASAVITKETGLTSALSAINKQPALIITDSQAFNFVSQNIPGNIPLTSFSILFARHKGNLPELLNSVSAIEGLQDGDKILIAESCTHNRQCNDIGTVKIPLLLSEHKGMSFNFETSSGGSFPSDPSQYKLIIHCGGCMLSETEMKSRIKAASTNNIPIINYGMLIAYLNGILDRCMRVFNNNF